MLHRSQVPGDGDIVHVDDGDGHRGAHLVHARVGANLQVRRLDLQVVQLLAFVVDVQACHGQHTRVGVQAEVVGRVTAHNLPRQRRVIHIRARDGANDKALRSVLVHTPREGAHRWRVVHVEDGHGRGLAVGETEGVRDGDGERELRRGLEVDGGAWQDVHLCRVLSTRLGPHAQRGSVVRRNRVGHLALVTAILIEEREVAHHFRGASSVVSILLHTQQRLAKCIGHGQHLGLLVEVIDGHHHAALVTERRAVAVHHAHVEDVLVGGLVVDLQVALDIDAGRDDVSNSRLAHAERAVGLLDGESVRLAVRGDVQIIAEHHVANLRAVRDVLVE